MREIGTLVTQPSNQSKIFGLDCYTLGVDDSKVRIFKTDLRFQASAVMALQEAAEAYLVSLFEVSSDLADETLEDGILIRNSVNF